MIFYRLFRYFAFLFCAGSLFLYAFRDSFHPFPALSPVFQSFDAYYRGLDQSYNAQGDPQWAEGILRSEAERLIRPEKDTLDSFLADEKTKDSLNSFDRGFNSLEALVRRYFVPDEAFQDLIITRQGAILYRYENVPLTQRFGISQNIPTESGILNIKVLYNPESFLGRVQRSESPIVFKWENNNTYAQNLQSRAFDRIILKTDTDTLSAGFEMVQQKEREILYFHKPGEPYIQGPVFYLIETLPSPQRLSHRALFIMFCLMALLLIFIADRQILKFLHTKSQKKMRESLFPTFSRSPESEDTLEWLDKLAANEFPEEPKTSAEEPSAPQSETEAELLPRPNRGGRDDT